MAHTNDSIESRLDRLETQNRTQRVMVVGLVMAGIALGLLGLTRANAIPDRIEANRIETKEFYLVDEKGKPKIIIGSADGNGLIGVVNREGESAVMIGTTDVDGKGIVVTYNGNDRELVALGATLNGAGLVTIHNSKGQEIIELGSPNEANGTGVVRVLDPAGIESPGLLYTKP